MKKMIFTLGVIFLFSGSGHAQSMLEYSALTTAASAAAAKAAKGRSNNQNEEQAQTSPTDTSGFVEEALTDLYGDSSQMMSSKAASLLGQVGGPLKMSTAVAPEAQEAPAVNTPQGIASPASSSIDVGSPVEVLLNSGQWIKGALVEQDKDYVKVDIAGVTTTVFKEEISRIE
jgi:hypothetical protein